ncbi:MAG: putative box helicase domain protein [Candidatus Saccharibacteria bacterium]|nr:putative box helicase domain protein [Candidatus Saccharibacteria bacterium]
MYKNTYRRGPSRPGVQSFSGSNRRNRKNAKQTIDPSRFIKAAAPVSTVGYEPKHNFADFEMHPLLKSNVTNKGYTVPSEIQDKTITLGLAGQNVVGIANTGTGKTAAFALPILNTLMRNPSSQALVIAPTRELAIQIEEQCRILAKNSGLSAAVLIGGMPLGRQKRDLKDGSRLIIGTPGRIKDHLNQHTLDLSHCGMVVLDEVDRMLDMGFINDVRFILEKLPTEHQAFFFSATMSPEINALIDTFSRDAVTVNVKVAETSQNVHQDVVRFSGNVDKIDSLHNVLIQPNVQKTLIFGKTKHGVERLSRELRARGFKSESMHGDKSQGQRKRALDSFRDNQIKVLVATDVAARGIDVKDITHVINYDVPQTYDDYVHRIGRAGRAGQAGYALTFVDKG